MKGATTTAVLRWVWKSLLGNLDTLAVILVALGLSVFSVVGTASVRYVLSGTLAVLALLAFSVLRNRLTDEEMSRTLTRMSVTRNGALTQEEAYEELERYVSARRIHSAILIQYSCTSARKLLKALLRSGAHVTVYIQDEGTAERVGSVEQAERVRSTVRFLRGELAGLFDSTKLSVRKYRTPCSVSAVKIDDQVLCMGWYTYEHVEDDTRNKEYRDDEVQISGHDVAAVMAWKGTPQYLTLDATFAMLEANYRRHAEDVPLA
jgi:hypothetical protein